METILTRTAISQATYISAIGTALQSSKYALNIELAAALACFAEAGNPTRDAKRALGLVYASAGYACLTQYEEDYKTINRRINTAAELFDFLGKDRITEWIGENIEMQIITTIAQHLTQFNLRTYNSVMSLVGKPVNQPRPLSATTAPAVMQSTKDEGKTEADKAGTGEEGSAEELTFSRRATDVPAESGTLFVNTEHMHVAIPPAVTKDELIAAAMQMLALANSLDGQVGEQSSGEPDKLEADDEQTEAIKQIAAESARAAEVTTPAAKKPRVHRLPKKEPA